MISPPHPTAPFVRLLTCCALLLGTPPAVNAVEVLTAGELASHCVRVVDAPDSVDGQYCIRYVQGFIDGAIATDARVMLSTESALDGSETFTERAMRTRMPSRADRYRAARLAGFCLGDPLPLRDVVDVVVADLSGLDEERADSPAMEVVYATLLAQYPCRD